MKVIFLREVPGTGHLYDVKDVAEGYAKNFLFPRKLAEPATPAALVKLEALKKQMTLEDAEHIKRLTEIAGLMNTHTLEFEVKTDDAGHVFGSITKEAILKALREHNWLGKERVDVLLERPIKELGEHKVPVDLKKGVTATLKVILRQPS